MDSALDYARIHQATQAIYEVMLTLHPETANQPSLKGLDPTNRFRFQEAQDGLSPEVRAVTEGAVYEAIFIAVSLAQNGLQKQGPSNDILAETAHNELLGHLAATCQIIMHFRNDDLIAVVHGTGAELLGSVLRQLDRILAAYFSPPRPASPVQVSRFDTFRPWRWLLGLAPRPHREKGSAR